MVLLFFFAFALAPVVDLLHALTNISTLALMAAASATLFWFVYRVFFRRWWRARHIANLRLRRMLEERESDQPGPRSP